MPLAGQGDSPPESSATLSVTQRTEAFTVRTITRFLLAAALLVLGVSCAERVQGNVTSHPFLPYAVQPPVSQHDGITPVATAVSSLLLTPTPGLPILVYLDPGHGGVDTGTIGTTNDGTQVEEKVITLAIARRTAQKLRRDGIGVMLSRTNDSLPGSQPTDYVADGSALTAAGVLADLQRRIDRANASGARVLLSIHLNGFDDPSVRGAETFYDSTRSFAAPSKSFADLIQNGLIAAYRAGGYDTPDRGVTDDTLLQTESLGALTGNYSHLILLGPAVAGQLRPSQMPGALSEPLFLSNPPEATAAVTAAMQNLIAGAYTTAIEQYLSETHAVGRPSPVLQTPG